MYREFPIDPRLRAAAVCTWQQVSRDASQAHVVPDACVDILWNGERLMLAGPDTRPQSLRLAASTQIHGLRFVPGAAGTLLGVPASAVRDARVELREVWGERARVLEAGLHSAARAEDSSVAIRLQLEAAVVERLRESGPSDPLALAVASSLRPALALDEPGSAATPSVAQLAAALGVSERQLLRRCDAAFGYGPKLLARVLRFQAFVRALRAHTQLGFAELALSLGYADQAHLAHDTAELAGVTPSQLRARWAAVPA